MSKRDPQSKRIPLITRVCFLKNCVALPFSDRDRICIAYPITPGLQAALIVSPPDKSGHAHIIDTLAMVPAEVLHEPPHIDSIYGNYLGFVTRVQRKKLEAASNNDFLRLWRKTARTEPPFRHVTLDRLMKELKPLIRSANADSARAIAAVRTAWARAFQWAIPHVHDGKAAKQSAISTRHWWVLNQWSKWEAQGIDLYLRFLAFRAQFPGPMPDDRTYRQMMNTFRKMCCDSLRLKYTGKTNRKQARRRLNDLRSERERQEASLH